MPDILLCRQQTADIPEKDLDVARRVIFGMVDGLGDKNQKRWRRFWNRLLKLEPGECSTVSTVLERSGPFHRRHFALEQAVFNAQDRFDEFEQFLVWLKVGSGWVDWIAGPKGGVIPLPRSVSYKAADQHEFAEFHAMAIRFLRGEYAPRYLWPHLKNNGADDMMNAILSEFNE